MSRLGKAVVARSVQEYHNSGLLGRCLNTSSFCDEFCGILLQMSLSRFDDIIIAVGKFFTKIVIVMNLGNR